MVFSPGFFLIYEYRDVHGYPGELLIVQNTIRHMRNISLTYLKQINPNNKYIICNASVNESVPKLPNTERKNMDDDRYQSALSP